MVTGISISPAPGRSATIKIDIGRYNFLLRASNVFA